MNIKLLNENATVPFYASAGAACFDIATDGDVQYDEYGNALCNTGLVFEVPDDHVMLVFSRSGHGFKYDISLSNSVGVIDSDYRGELKVKLRADSTAGQEILDNLHKGDRIAQAMILPVTQVTLNVVETLTETERGTNGFGSTGIKS